MSLDDVDEPGDRLEPTGDELALSAYLDGVASSAEVARVEGDPVLRERLTRYRAVASLLAQERERTLAADPHRSAPGDSAPETAGVGASGAAELEGAELEAALDRARAAALVAAHPATAADAADAPVTALRRAGRGSHPAAGSARRALRRRPGRWAVQVLGLAAALLAAVGAAALLRSAEEDDDTANFQAAEAATSTAPPDGRGALGEHGPMERAVAGQARDAAAKGPALPDDPGSTPEPTAASTPPEATASTPSLGDFATVEDLVARLTSSLPTTAIDPASPAATASSAPPGPPASSSTDSPSEAGPVAIPGASCAPPRRAVLGTATVGGRPVLVVELPDPGGRPRLVGFALDDCSRIFDRLR